MQSVDTAMRWARSKTSDEQRKIVKFVISGVIKTALGYGLYVLLLWWGAHRNVALAGDYVFALTLGYVVNRHWTFSNQGHAKAAVRKYLISYALIYVLNALCLKLAVEVMGMTDEIGQIPCLVIATVASYVLQRYWVFQGTPKDLSQ